MIYIYIYIYIYCINNMNLSIKQLAKYLINRLYCNNVLNIKYTVNYNIKYHYYAK